MRAGHLNLPKLSEAGCQRFSNMRTPTYPSMPEFGLTVERLLEELQERFPLTNPTINEDLNTIMYRAGQRDVVDWVYSRLSDEDS